MKQFDIEGQKSYWGDKCSDKFRKPSLTGRKPVIEDLFAYREQLLEGSAGGLATGVLRVGLPRAMSLLDQLPFWKRYFAELGIETVPLPGDRSAHLGRGPSTWLSRSRAIRCKWLTGTCRRWRRRA